MVREEQLIWRLSRAIETRDRATGEHISRLAAIEKIIAQQPGLDKNYCHTPYLAKPLHDAGKIGGSDAVLNKPGKLTREERKEIERHTEIAANILQGDENDLIRMAHEIALSHHEKWDGTGHGRGLAGQDIPLSGRIAAVPDVFDVPCSDRAHKDAWPFDDAVEEVLQHSGTHFDPKCVSAFKAGNAEIRKLYTAQPAALQEA
ncbi:HD-GYP domain-containing protein [Yoonia sediminilitoris]|uniref:HD domain-containing protein n=1 Tax=Yoonia sediminilitoris TaxID=1286148 RepID=A0A2T6KJV0_9RHOB|nr:HD domain-containing phosphohydrolase [Yoonia sediminilitoris]PUB16202.1 HD domain-containing protein [Yoonia sediminilitoris]RCW96551.1 HD domain-containing protein [Yoonia sediminilitoris]